MGVFLVFVAACFCSASNFCMRRSIDQGGTTRAFLVLGMGIGCAVNILLGPLRTQDFAINPFILLLGISAGLVYSFMFEALGKALEKGPPGLTFSILSGSTVFPAVVMSLYFGAAFGFVYTFWHAVGSLIVLFGLFWASRGFQGMEHFRAWVFFVSTMFCLHICLLVIFQWRALLMNFPYFEGGWLSFEQTHAKSQWFLPIMFGVAMLMQLYGFLKKEKRVLQRPEIFNGVAGGFANSLGTFFLVWATEAASSLEHAVIYPAFSVLVILFSNLWSQKIYQETVNWKACRVCALGLLVATVDWKAVLAAVGL